MKESDSNPVLFVDKSILAVNKPANVSVIHDSLRPNDATLVDQFQNIYGPLWVVHRLDRETSGVIVFARTKESHSYLNNLFQTRRINKIYHLLACGDFTWQEVEVDLPLLVDGDRQHRTVINSTHGKPALTYFKILQSFHHSLSYVQAEPKSGYTHQIRAHFSSLDGMILNDRVYKPHPFPVAAHPFIPTEAKIWANEYLPIHRLALHAEKITLIHPSQGTPLSISAPYPEDFSEALAILKTTDQA